MIGFNVAPFTGKEFDYIRQAIEAEHICGDGMFTKKCNGWIEERTGTAKALLTTSCTHATEMAALLLNIQPGDEVIMPSYLQPTPLSCEERFLCLWIFVRTP